MLIYILLIISCIKNNKNVSKLENKKMNFLLMENQESITFTWNKLDNVVNYTLHNSYENPEVLEILKILSPDQNRFKLSKRKLLKRNYFILEAKFRDNTSVKEKYLYVKNENDQTNDFLNYNFEQNFENKYSIESEEAKNQFYFIKEDNGIKIYTKDNDNNLYIITCANFDENNIYYLEDAKFESANQPLRDKLGKDVVIPSDTIYVQILNLSSNYIFYKNLSEEAIPVKETKLNKDFENNKHFKDNLENFLRANNLKFSQKDEEGGLYDLINKYPSVKFSLDDNIKFLIYSLNKKYKFVSLKNTPSLEYNKILQLKTKEYKQDKEIKFDETFMKKALEFYMEKTKSYYKKNLESFNSKTVIVNNSYSSMEEFAILEGYINPSENQIKEIFINTLRKFIISVVFLFENTSNIHDAFSYDSFHSIKEKFYLKRAKEIYINQGMETSNINLTLYKDEIKVSNFMFYLFKDLLLNVYHHISLLENQDQKDIIFEEITKIFINCNQGTIDKLNTLLRQIKIQNEEGDTSSINSIIENQLLKSREDAFQATILYFLESFSEKSFQKVEMLSYMTGIRKSLNKKLRLLPQLTFEDNHVGYDLKGLKTGEKEFIKKFKEYYNLRILEDLKTLNSDFLIENFDTFLSGTDINSNELLKNLIKTLLTENNDYKAGEEFYIFCLMKMGIVKTN